MCRQTFVGKVMSLLFNMLFRLAQMVKRLPTMWEIRVQYLGWEDLLEKEMATHSSVFDWEISWIKRSLAAYSPWGR